MYDAGIILKINGSSLSLFSFVLDVQMFVLNRETYGYLPVPLRAHNTLRDEADSFIHSVLEVNGEDNNRYISKSLLHSLKFSKT